MTSPSRQARPAVVYAIADVDVLGADRTVDAAAAMAEAGVGTLQLRAKRMPDGELHRLCEALCGRLAQWPGALWIDDRADLAALFPFAGVHLGQRDIPPAAARAALPPDRAIGWSTHGSGQVRRGDGDPDADWLAIGPVFPTASKARPDPVVGVEGVRTARAATRKPLIAIGGIDAGNLASVLAAGADSVAVLAAVCRGDVAANCRRLLRAAGAVA